MIPKCFSMVDGSLSEPIAFDMLVSFDGGLNLLNSDADVLVV